MAVLTRTLTLADFLPDHLPVTFASPKMTDEEFFAFCAEIGDYEVEYTSEGTVIIMPPTDARTSARNVDIIWQLTTWSKEHGGHVTGPDGSYRLANGARRAPDAAWIDSVRWSGKQMTAMTPNFAIELRSPEQRIRLQREKMQEYIDNGVQLGWLIDPAGRSVTIFRPGREPETLANPKTVAGEGPVEGFVLDLRNIF